MATLRFGIKTAPQNTNYADIVRVWREADALPVFEHAWLFDHFAPIFSDLDGPCYEGFTLLAALAAQTSRIRVGLMVAGNTYRHPAVLAHMGATIDVIANGRFDMGLGAGWNEYEHTSMGLPLYAPGERIRRLGEACEIIKRLYTQHLTDFAGRYYQLKEARCEPKPVQQPYPPFVIGGGGEQLTLRIAAQYADVWNFAGGPVDTFKHKVTVLHEHCAAIGRDPGAIALSVQIPVNYENLAETVQMLQGYVDAGATHLILNLRYPYPAGIVARLAEEVVPNIT
ncbi:MAG TPA: LLM class F420-dependent oxidoreductase [Kouleothrix sp.]|nr:LLM class F420-dependent oxidoreductase [Kouleothrix sp.]